ncbi:hypothetical protein QCA50_013639 [Cerrena zonata]|uniref:Uncharacterized protein n=1 Tax=Cerrena zonata TaxID=2478898 RepID=A0AAW0FTE7_9APHY
MPKYYSRIAKIFDNNDFVGSPATLQDCKWLEQEGRDVACRQRRTMEDGPAECATFTVVGTVAHRDFHMAAHGDWTPLIGPPMHNHYGSFELISSTSALITLSWPTVVANLHALEKDSARGHEVGTSIVREGGLSFRHRLYKRITRRSTMAITDALRDPFSLEKWPLETEEQEKARRRMLNSMKWTPRPLPAYTMVGDPMLPALYDILLPGSMVSVSFIIVREFHHERPYYNFFAEVDQIHILRTSLVINATPAENNFDKAIQKWREEKKASRKSESGR